MTGNPVIQRGLQGHTRGNTTQQMIMEIAQKQTGSETILSSGFVSPKKKTDKPRGSGVKAYQESKLSGKRAVTQTEVLLFRSACLRMGGSPQEGTWLFPPLLPTFLFSRMPGPVCSALKEEDF